MFILSSISSSLVNHTSIYEKSELKVFKNFQVKFLIIDQITYPEEIYARFLNSVYNHC